MRESDLYGTTEMQDMLLPMLKDFTEFCRQQHIRYSLCGGTLLGAIRHKGFIPWDDDLDVMVSRQQFKHLLKKIHLFKGYTIHRRLWVYRIQREDASGDEGSFPTIDLLVIDNCPDDELLRKFKVLTIRMLQGMMHTKLELEGHSAFEKFLLVSTYLMGRPFPDSFLYRIYNAVSQIGNRSKTKYVTSYNDLFKLITVRYDGRLMRDLTWTDFEDARMPVTQHYDNYLTEQYGDYMTPPAKDDRVPIHML